MGRGDKKTAKGKRFKGSFGKSRPAKPKKKVVDAAVDHRQAKKLGTAKGNYLQFQKVLT